MDADVLKLIGGGTTVGALLALIYVVGLRLVAAIDRVSVVVNEHTKVDIAHHGEVRAAIAELDGRVGGLIEAGERRATPALGILRRPPTNRER